MKLSGIISEANDVADKYNLQLNTKAQKDKLNLALVFKRRSLYGYDSQGGKYRCHPLDAPDEHVFVDDRKSIGDFVCESMEFLESRDIL